ncbi:hypothetical protein AMATHDRAFT_4782 [Amanita thiersii Skay4041]|uniref:Uncharacterized protein n=1 Tax=Amanita thiersii Skay4041 TaxID=703135 RepID=A0A2A9NEY4_9AGAR|nr:hypothetical protein AMATHDRAFT_4782 [Amanita thiersii Skay4041]
MAFFSSASSRPILPPLQSLNLPIPVMRAALAYEDASDHESCRAPLKSTRNHNRHVSISSSITSRSPSPLQSGCSAAQPPVSRSPAPSPTNESTGRGDLKFRLVPCSFESADAFVYVPPSGTASSVTTTVSNDMKGQELGARPLLLVGPAVTELRQPSQKLAKGARVHPYRIVRSTSSIKLREM